MNLYLRQKMCRISGGFAPDIKQKISFMADSLKKGGDNIPNFYFDENFAMSHNRLSIIDLSQNAAQPAFLGRYIMVFNGEIYNYKELANELGIKETSDTKVLLQMYARYKKDCLQKLDGMFAFCIYDKIDKSLFLARDRYGVKPLYYYHHNGKFIFASELKAFFAYNDFDKAINKTALNHYLNTGYTPRDQSIFTFIKKLPPSSYLEFKNELKITKYYDIKSKFQIIKSNDTKDFKEILTNSILSRTISDTGFCLFLSGGIDSSLSAAILAKNGFKFPTICVGFDEKNFDESIYAKQVAKKLNLEHHTFIMTQKIAHDLLLKLPEIYDEPFGDISALPTLFLCQKAREFSKVALSSDGGDELNFGYTRYKLNYERWKFYKKFTFLKSFANLPYEFWKIAFSMVGKNISKDKFSRIKDSFKAKNFMELYALEFRHFKSSEVFMLDQMTLPNFDEYLLSDEFESMSFADFSSYLSDDIFVKTDRASMSVGLEVREPFLSYKLVDYTLNLEPNLRVEKRLLKEVLNEYLPQNLINRPKMGFSVPLQDWFYQDLGYLLDEYMQDQDIFDKAYIKNLLFDFRAKKRVNFAKIWNILFFLMWKRKWKI